MRGCVLALMSAATLWLRRRLRATAGRRRTRVQGWDGAARGGVRYVAVPTPG
jgi:hypothetical protein